MIKAMKEYYLEVLVPYYDWLTRHWKGYVAFNVVLYVVTMGWTFKNEIKERIAEKFSKEEEES